MSVYTVIVERVVRMQAVVDVEAATPEEARDRAPALVDEHGTAWEEVSTVSERTLRAPRRG